MKQEFILPWSRSAGRVCEPGGKMVHPCDGNQHPCINPWEGNNAVTGLIKAAASLPLSDSAGFRTLNGLAEIFLIMIITVWQQAWHKRMRYPAF